MTDEHAHHHAAEAIAGSVDAITALWGGFSSFFSLWFFCLLQISPFFIAFMAASIASLEGKGEGTLAGRIVRGMIPTLSCAAGYILFFALVGAMASSTGMLLFRYNSLLGQFGGILSLLLGAWFLGVLRIPGPAMAITTGGGFLLGAALAFNYRPCTTPTLTLIYNLALDPATVGAGAGYLAIYAAGASLSFMVTGVVLSTALFAAGKEAVFRGVRIAGGILLVIFGILVVTDWMMEYKSFLVGGFV